MSLSSKVQKLVSDAISKINGRADEVKRLNSELKYVIDQARKEIESEKKNIEEGRARSRKIDDAILENRRRELLQEVNIFREQGLTEIGKVEQRVNSRISEFLPYFEELESHGKDPRIIDAYINACFALDEKLAQYLEEKRHPAYNAAETVRLFKMENRKCLQRIKALEYQLSELWANEEDISEKEEFELEDDDEERIKKFLSATEYASLSETERNQKALDNYLLRHHTKSHIGKMYERYIGYLYEMEGYDVEYRGIEMGLKDGGIDLVCRKGGEILLVQCKNWSTESTIYEKHICQLFGAAHFYNKDRMQGEYTEGLFDNVDRKRIIPVFVTTTDLDGHALEVSKTLGVVVRSIPLEKSYPIIKCNVNNGERIYHLPIDQMYDKTKVCDKREGECYVSTILEAEQKGFRRAYRWRGN
jgi:hypothetical protein